MLIGRKANVQLTDLTGPGEAKKILTVRLVCAALRSAVRELGDGGELCEDQKTLAFRCLCSLLPKPIWSWPEQLLHALPQAQPTFDGTTTMHLAVELACPL